jgi:hypothetical protein
MYIVLLFRRIMVLMCSMQKKPDRFQVSGAKVDRKFEYTKMLIWGGFNDMAQREAVRYNDGEKMTLYWKLDMINCFHRNYPKYFILGHRLIPCMYSKGCYAFNTKMITILACRTYCVYSVNYNDDNDNKITTNNTRQSKGRVNPLPQ